MIRLKVMRKPSLFGVMPAFLLIAVILASCASRYRLDLFISEGDHRARVKVEKTEFMVGAVLGDPLSRDKAEPGDGNVLVLVTGSRGATTEDSGTKLISYDRYARFRLFVQLPSDIEAGPVELLNKSLLQMMGRYELAAEDKVYYSAEGGMDIDSLASGKLFGTIDARFANHNGERIRVDGQFKAKIAD